MSWEPPSSPNVEGTVTPENSGSAMICIELPPLCEVYAYELRDRTWIRTGAVTEPWVDEHRRECNERGVPPSGATR
jgi:hypothetical protein